MSKADVGPKPIMSVAELKPLLHLARRQAVNCAIAMGKDKQGLILLHRRTKPRKLLAELKRQAKASGTELDLTSIRFGRASVDGASDSAMVTFTVNKPAPGPMRRALLEQVRPAGFQRCEIVVDEALESETDDEDVDGTANTDHPAPHPAVSTDQDTAGLAQAQTGGGGAPRSAASAASGVTAAGQPGAAQAANGAAASRGASDVKALTDRLASVARRMMAAPPLAPAAGDAAKAAAFAARDALRSGDIAKAERLTGKLERLVNGTAAALPAAGPGQGQPIQSAANHPAAPGRNMDGLAPREDVIASGAGSLPPAAAAGGAPGAPAGPGPAADATRPTQPMSKAALMNAVAKVRPGMDTAALRAEVARQFPQMTVQFGGLNGVLSGLADPARQSDKERLRAISLLSTFAGRDMTQPDPAEADAAAAGCFKQAIALFAENYSGAVRERVLSLASDESIATILAFVGLFLAAQWTPAGWVLDGILAATVALTAVSVGVEIDQVIKHVAAFVSECRKPKGDPEVAAKHLADAAAALTIDLLVALLLHKGGNAAKPYVKPSPGFVDMITPQGALVRVPAAVVAEAAGARPVVVPVPMHMTGGSGGGSQDKGETKTEGNEGGTGDDQPAPNQMPPKADPRAAQKLENALSAYQSERYAVGRQTFQLDKAGMRHILQRHSREFWNGSTKSRQTFLSQGTTFQDVQRIVGEVLSQNRDTIIRNPATKPLTLLGRSGGLSYQITVAAGRVVQFYPN